MKILLAGPPKSGKSFLANLLGDRTIDIDNHFYSTTSNFSSILKSLVGCRIVSSKVGETEIDLWDFSGDLKYDRLWPAATLDLNGIVFVIDAAKGYHSSQLSAYVAWFAHELPREKCLIMKLAEESVANNSANETKVNRSENNFGIVEKEFLFHERQQILDTFNCFARKLK